MSLYQDTFLPKGALPRCTDLGLSVGYNSSDMTYGWNGFMDGFAVYHLHLGRVVQLPELFRS